jgi:hypothetical protein
LQPALIILFFILWRKEKRKNNNKWKFFPQLILKIKNVSG